MFTLPAMPYAYNALEPYIDEMTMQIHHDKHHQAYIDNLNKALEGEEKLASMNVEDLVRNLAKVPETIRTKVRNHGGGHVNHTLFWQIMAPATGQEPEGELVKAIHTTFGSLPTFQEKFATLAMGRFGSGWVWLVVDPSTSSGQVGLSIVDTPNQDSPLMDHKIPLLGLDVWEHAYYLKYQNKRADYINAWWSVVNWKEVEKRFVESAK